MNRITIFLCFCFLGLSFAPVFLERVEAQTSPIILSMEVESFHVGNLSPMKDKIDVGDNVTGITQKLSELLLILVVAGSLLGGAFAVFKMVTSGEKGIGEGKMMLEKIIKGILISFTAYTIVRLLSFVLSKIFGQ